MRLEVVSELPAPDTNLFDLQCKHELSRIIDTIEGGWKTLLLHMPASVRGYYTPAYVDRLTCDAQRRQMSAAAIFLDDLGNKLFTVSDLIAGLHGLKHERALLLLRPHESVRITQQPAAWVNVNAGDVFQLQCQAAGFPYPCYRWFQLEEGGSYAEIQGCRDSLLSLRVPADYKCSNGDRMYVTCRVHNAASDCVYSNWCRVDVLQPITKTAIDRECDDDGGRYSDTIASTEDNNLTSQLDTMSIRDAVAPPVIVEQPRNETAPVGGATTFVCRAADDGVATATVYQWYKLRASNCVALYAETKPTLKIEDVRILDGDCSFYCVISNHGGSVKSREVRIVVENRTHTTGPPLIVRDPVTQEAPYPVGHVVTLSVDAQGEEPLSYTWFRDGAEMRGETGRRLELQLESNDSGGNFMCVVTNRLGKTHTRRRCEVRVDRPTADTIYTASLKVALLIGNQDYEGLGRLHNPATDVETLARCLASLSFRVIALVNLTHAEMNNALNEFCSMLHEGAYGVFYYAGHGFKKDELSYMVPLETPHSAGDDGGVAGFSCDDCLCVQRALACMQETGAALNLLILDMCRAESRELCIRGPVRREEVVQSDRSLCVYTTTRRAYDVKGGGNGVFMRYLAKYAAMREKTVVEMLALIKEEIGELRVQTPELHDTLADIRRKLSDPVRVSGALEGRQRAALARWEELHSVGDKKVFTVADAGMTVEVSFLRPFSADSMYLSNVLVVSVRVTDLGHTQGCTAFVAAVTADGGGDVTSDRVAGSDNMVRTHIYNVQRLRGALYLQLQINYVMRDQSRHSIGGWIDAGLPLVASASLWKQADSRGVQSECSEDEIHSSA